MQRTSVVLIMCLLCLKICLGQTEECPSSLAPFSWSTHRHIPPEIPFIQLHSCGHARDSAKGIIQNLTFFYVGT